MRFLIGVDDTDNPMTSSTGLLAQRLGLHLQETGLGTLEAVTRHQLLLSAQIPHTSDNSAICVTFEADSSQRTTLELTCRSFIMREFSPGADAGFAFASWGQVTAEVFTWARLAKTRVLQRQDAINIARAAKIGVAGLTGSGMGVIGALAAIGLRFRGEDGRFLWLRDMALLQGTYTAGELIQTTPFDHIETLRGRSPRADDKVLIEGEVRPLLREGRCVLLVEEERLDPTYDWHLLNLDKVRQLSN